ncbi:uncharacterized protein LOC142507103 [Primulina tabacum]|uniref:uncharacterized protein LOC142507103 n=1 Tax=Primulina tabacum TaxID=48773 RepID=UPI003F5955B6
MFKCFICKEEGLKAADCPRNKGPTTGRDYVMHVDEAEVEPDSTLITALTKKNAKFIWGLECQESFEKLKQALTSTTVLAMPSGQGEYVLYKDALKLGLGEILMQHDIEEIQRFELAVYARGDAPNLSTLTVQSTLKDKIRAAQSSDEQLQNLRLRDESKGLKLYSVKDSVVRYCNGLWVPSGDSLGEDIMKKSHITPYSIHLGSTKMHKYLQTFYWWPGMKRDILRFVSECLTYQPVNAENQ